MIHDTLQRRLAQEGSLPPGTYSLHKPLRVRGEVNLEGVLLKQAHPNVDLLEVESRSGVVGGRLLGLGALGDGSGIRGRGSLSGVSIEGTRLEAFGNCGVRLGSAGETTVRDVELARVHVTGGLGDDQGMRKDILLYARAFEDIAVMGCVCQGHAPSSLGAGTIASDSGIALVHNTDQRGTYGRWMRNVRLEGNACDGHRRHGILVCYANERAEEVVVRGNTCSGNGWVGIYVDHHRGFMDARFTLVENACRGNGWFEQDHPSKSIRGGIVLTFFPAGEVRRNVCTGNVGSHGAGLRLRVDPEAAPGAIVVAENDWHGNSASGLARWNHWPEGTVVLRDNVYGGGAAPAPSRDEQTEESGSKGAPWWRRLLDWLEG